MGFETKDLKCFPLRSIGNTIGFRFLQKKIAYRIGCLSNTRILRIPFHTDWHWNLQGNRGAMQVIERSLERTTSPRSRCSSAAKDSAQVFRTSCLSKENPSSIRSKYFLLGGRIITSII